MDERRQHQRIRAYRPVRLYKPASAQVVETLTKDLSVEGLRCLSATVVPVSTEFTVEVVCEPGEEPITARGRAVWFRNIPDSEQFDIGVTFLDLTPQTKRRLSVYLDRLSHHLSAL